MKKLLCLPIILCVLFSFSGCDSHTTLKNRVLIEGIAIDYVEEKFLVTIQTYKPSSIQESKNEYEMHAADGSTIFEAVQNLDSITGQQAFFANVKTVVLSRSVVDLGLSTVLDYFVRHEHIPRSVSMVCTPGKSAELLEISCEANFLPSTRIDKIVKLQNDQTNFPRSELMDIANQYLSDSQDAYMPLLQVNETGQDKAIDIIGLLCFDGNTPSGVLYNEDAAGFNWVCGYKNKRTIVIEKDDLIFSFSAKDVSSKITSQIVDNAPHFKITIHIDCNLDEISTDGSQVTEEDIIAMTPRLSEEIERIVSHSIDTAFFGLNSDIFRIGAHLKMQQRNYWLSLSNWSEQKSNATFDYDVNARIYRTGRENRAI